MAKKEINIGEYVVSENSSPYMIAEIGINHNGDMQVAKKLIDAAFCCGWHCVKFQKREPDIAVPDTQKNTMRDTPWGKMTYLDYKKRIEFGKPEYDYIDRYCKEKPIDWTASPWDAPSTEFLLQYDIPFIKIASATNDNENIIRIASQSKKPLIVSTGMSTLEEIDHTVNFLEKYTDGNYILMHTNSTYPTAIDEINLRVIDTLRERYDCLVGYSGHEYGLQPTAAAAVMGACVIERHVTLDHNMWGTDHASSIEINAMWLLARRIADIRVYQGYGEKKLGENEMMFRKKLRGK